MWSAAGRYKVCPACCTKVAVGENVGRAVISEHMKTCEGEQRNKPVVNVRTSSGMSNSVRY